jgi:hypothetical protein
MEDPVRFHVWGKIIPAKREEALRVIRSQATYPDEVELRKAVMNCLREKRPVQVSLALGYSAAQQLTAAIAEQFEELTYSQEGYTPAGQFCPKHNFYFGGCLGCHLCSGFFEE